jgi:hypothetical protein
VSRRSRQSTAYRADLETLLSALRSPSGSNTVIVIGTYDNPIATCTLAGVPGAVQLGALTLEGGGPIAAGLHDVMRQVAARPTVARLQLVQGVRGVSAARALATSRMLASSG